MISALRRWETRKKHIDALKKCVEKIDQSSEELLKSFHNIQLKKLRSAQKIQMSFRKYLLQKRINTRIELREAAVTIQRVYRGWLGRIEYYRRRQSMRGLISDRALLDRLISHSHMERQIGKWIEYRNQETKEVFYFNSKSEESRWDPPSIFLATYYCSWIGCKQKFSTLSHLRTHEKTHTWKCAACYSVNSIQSFPICEVCKNHFSAAAVNLKPLHTHHRSLLELRETEKVRRMSTIDLSQRVLPAVLSPAQTIPVLEQQIPRHSSSKEYKNDIPFDEYILEEDLSALGTAQDRITKLLQRRLSATQRSLVIPSMGAPYPQEVVDRLKEIVFEFQKTVKVGIGKREFGNGYVFDGELQEGVLVKGTIVFPNGNKYVGEFKDGYRDGVGRFEKLVGSDWDPSLKTVDGSNTMKSSLKWTYDGNWVRGSMNGYGVLRSSNGFYYKGEWKSNRMDGLGVLVCGNGDQYEGMFESGRYHGRGKFTKKDKTVYDGECQNGVACGLGILKGNDGSVYKGEWSNNKRNGRGIASYPDGSSYRGFWKDDLRHGQGSLHGTTGESYNGHWEQGVKSGHGVMTFSNGDVYDGAWHENVPHGVGVYSYTSQGHIYEGNWQNGTKHGQGLLRFKNGAKYEGSFFKGRVHGIGTMRYVNGDVYTGHFKNGIKDGKGRYEFANGSVYDGDFVNDQVSGVGEMHYYLGHRYVGSWLDGKRCGHGKMMYQGGEIYEGDWSEDKREGQGVAIYHSSTELEQKYVGSFHNNLYNGYGTYTYEDGDIYEGEWCDGVRQGNGIYKGVDGQRYEGHFESNLYNGLGVLYGKDGSKYEGEWKDDMKHGKGVLSQKDGKKYEGEFEFDQPNGEGVENVYRGRWENGLKVGEGTYSAKTRSEGDPFNELRIKVFGY